jgi:outer membrane protein TolC
VSGTGLVFNANKGMAETTLNPSEMISPELGMALAQSFPPEALAALANPVSISMMKNGALAGINAVQPIFAGGQIINGNKLAKVGEEAARLQLQLSENEVENQTEQYYWQLVSMQEKLKTIDAVDSMLAGIHKDVDVAVRAGVAMRNDLLQVQLRQNELKSQRLKLNNGIDIVRQLLAQYCGLSTTDFALAQPSFQDEGLAMSAVAPESALPNIPEYQLLQKQVEVAQLQRKMEIGKNLPSVAVGAGYNYHNMLDVDRTFAMVFATVSIPISDWWGGSHAVKRSKLEYQKALDEQQDKSELLKIRMRNAWNSVEESYQQLAIARQSIEQAAENLRLNQNFYQAGTNKMSDLLEAQMLYQQSLDRRVDAFINYQISLLNYRQASGQ